MTSLIVRSVAARSCSTAVTIIVRRASSDMWHLPSSGREEVRVHPAQESIVETMVRRASDHRVDAASRAQRGLVGIGPCLDIDAGVRAKAEEATAACACFDLSAMLRRVLVGCD